MADFVRQLDILPPRALIHPLTIIGLGGIGSPTAYTARKMGFGDITLWDHDIVEAHNLPSQHYDREDLGKSKAAGMERQLTASLDADCRITATARRFGGGDTLEGVVISGVDSMSARQEIWSAVMQSVAMVPLYIDGRIGVEWDEERRRVNAELIEIFTVVPARLADCDLYEAQLFPDADAAPFRCTAQAVAYLGPLVAGFISANLRKWFMGEPYPRHFIFDCLTNQFLRHIL